MQHSLALALQHLVVQRRVWVCAAAVVGFAAATAIAAQVRLPLPFSPVPITLQTMIVLLAGASLGRRAGAGSQALYVGAGAIGAPVFAGGVAGLGGLTAGYLLAFPLAAWLVGWAHERGRMAFAAGLAGGALLILASGSAWLAAVMGVPLNSALAVGLVPFLPGDALKVVAVWLLAGPAVGACRRAIGNAHGEGRR